MQKLVWTTDGQRFIIRDDRGMLHFTNRQQAREYATAAEIREAVNRYQASLMPLPQYNAAEDAYYWDDPEELWSAEDVAADARKLWPLMDVDALLESSRLMAKLGITD
jgi:hypothetical protein